MAWVGTAIAAAVTIGNTLVQKNQAEKARKRADRQAERDRLNTQKAAVFAETTGEAIGDLGIVDLSLDEDLTESQKLNKKGRASSTLSI